MKITSLIINLIKYRLKGFKLIDFWVGENFPPNDYCDFIVSDCNYDKSITLINWIKK